MGLKMVEKYGIIIMHYGGFLVCLNLHPNKGSKMLNIGGSR